MNQLEIIKILETMQKRYQDNYIHHFNELYYGSRTRSVNANIVEISRAMNENPNKNSFKIAKKLFFEAMQKDYWYQFIKTWN